MIFVIAATSLMAIFTVAAAAHRRGMDNARVRRLADRIWTDVKTQSLRESSPRDIKDRVAPEYGGIYKYDVTFRPIARGNIFVVTITIKLPGENNRTETFEETLPRRYP